MSLPGTPEMSPKTNKDMSTERIQSILQQINTAKDQAFRSAVRAAAENLVEETQDESKDIRDSILDLQMMIHSAYREINEQEESFFKLPMTLGWNIDGILPSLTI